MANISSISDDRGTIQGELSVGARSDDNSLLLGGTANADETIRIYNSSDLIAEITADENGNWQYEASGLSEGANEFSVSSIDADGNESVRSSAYLIEVDQSVMTATNIELTSDEGSLNNGGVTTKNQVTLSGQSEANAAVEIFDGSTSIGVATADENGEWSLDLQLETGEHNLTAQVTDDVGNTSVESSAISIEVEEPAPVAQTAAPQALAASASPAAAPTATPDVVLPSGTTIVDGGFRNDDTPLIRGMSTPHAEITLSVYSDTYGPVTAGADGIWEIQITNPLPQGTATFRAKATNAAGDAFFGYTLTIDSEAAPAPTIDYAEDDVGTYQDDLHHQDHTDDDAIKIHGTGTAGETIKLYDGSMLLGETVVDSSGSWNYSITNSLLEKLHEFTAISQDEAGNLSDVSNTFEITVDRTIAAPVISHVIDNVGSKTDNVNNGGKTDDAQPVIEGTAEAGATIEVFKDGSSLGTVSADDSGIWQFPITADLIEGDHSFTAKQVDLAGNASGSSDEFDLTIALNEDPNANTDAFSVNAPTELDVLGNDTDSDGDALTVSSIVSQGSQGVVSIDANGKVIYTPNATNIRATDSFTYEVSDGRGGFDTATVTVEVYPELSTPTIDLIAASDSGKFNTDNITNDTSPTLEGTAGADASLTIYLGSQALGNTTADANGNWSYTVSGANLNDGVHSFTAQSTFLESSASSAALEVTIDTVVDASVTLPAAQARGAWFGNAQAVRFNLTTTEEVSYNIKDVDFSWGSRVWYNPGRSITANGSASSSRVIDPVNTYQYSHGYFTFEATLTDIAGNVKVDRLTPVVVDPIASLKDGGYVVTYLQLSDDTEGGFDVILQRYSAQGDASGAPILVNSFTQFDQVNSDVTGLDDGGFVVTWQSSGQDGDREGIFSQRYDTQSQAVGPETQVNIYTHSDQQRPEVASLANGGYAIIWMSDGQDGSGQGVYMRLYDSNGNATSGEIRVNDITEDNQSFPTLTSLQNGDVVISWQAKNSLGDTDIMAEIIRPDGTLVRADFAINTDQGNQTQPNISAMADGGFALSWMSSDADNNLSIFAQTFDENGTPRTEAPLLINQDAAVGSSKPEVTGLKDGSLVVTWSADDSDSLGVYISKYSSDGSPIFQERLINPEAGSQSEPHIVALEDGGYLVTWSDIQTEQGVSSVWGQQFDANDQATSSPFEVGLVADYGDSKPSSESTSTESTEAGSGPTQNSEDNSLLNNDEDLEFADYDLSPTWADSQDASSNSSSLPLGDLLTWFDQEELGALLSNLSSNATWQAGSNSGSNNELSGMIGSEHSWLELQDNIDL